MKGVVSESGWSGVVLQNQASEVKTIMWLDQPVLGK